jgi:antitoxin component of RelBE/YafQ-DinJ toxin-antitoxin module
MNNDNELIIFKIPKPMKKQFQEICRSRNVTLTSTINAFIADYIKENTHGSDDEDRLPLAFKTGW